MLKNYSEGGSGNWVLGFGQGWHSSKGLYAGGKTGKTVHWEQELTIGKRNILFFGIILL